MVLYLPSVLQTCRKWSSDTASPSQARRLASRWATRVGNRAASIRLATETRSAPLASMMKHSETWAPRDGPSKVLARSCIGTACVRLLMPPMAAGAAFVPTDTYHDYIINNQVGLCGGSNGQRLRANGGAANGAEQGKAVGIEAAVSSSCTTCPQEQHGPATAVPTGEFFHGGPRYVCLVPASLIYVHDMGMLWPPPCSSCC